MDAADTAGDDVPEPNAPPPPLPMPAPVRERPRFTVIQGGRQPSFTFPVEGMQAKPKKNQVVNPAALPNDAIRVDDVA